MKECQWQITDERHQMFGQTPSQSRLKSMKSFLNCVTPLKAGITTSEARVSIWGERISTLPPSTTMGLTVSEQLPPGADASWARWKCLNRLRTGVGRGKVSLNKWGYCCGPGIGDEHDR